MFNFLWLFWDNYPPKAPTKNNRHLDTHNHPHLRPLVQTRKNKYTCTHRDFAYIHVYAQKYHLKLHAIFFEPSKKVKAKNLAERGPKIIKIQKIQNFKWGKEKLQQNVHFLLKQTKNYFARLFFGFLGLDDPQRI